MKEQLPSQDHSIQDERQFDVQPMGRHLMPPEFSLQASSGVVQRSSEQYGTNNMPELTGSVYDAKGNPQGILGNDTGEPIVLFNKKLLKTIRKDKKAARKSDTEYKLDASEWKTIDYCILPPLSHREKMKEIMEEDDTSGYKEFGGRGLIPIDSESGKLQHDKKTHVRSKDGKVAVPGDEAANIQLDSVHKNDRNLIGEVFPSGSFATDYTWHSHPGGSWKKRSGEPDAAFKPAKDFDQEAKSNQPLSGTTIGGSDIVTKYFDLGPSEADIQNAHRRYAASQVPPSSDSEEVYPMNRNFVIHKREKKVFFYNQETPIGKGNHNGIIPLDVFWSLK